MASPSPTIIDKLAVLPLIFKLLSSTIYALFTAPFRDPAGIGAPTVREHVHNAALRAVTSSMRIGTAQWLSPTFLKTYISWCGKRGRKPDIVDIPAAGLPDPDGSDGAQRTVKAFWLGNKDTAKYVMIYAHGGGFVFAGSAQHLNMLDRWTSWSQGSLAILCVCYSLSPGAVYPVAVGEIVETLRWILSPSGGNRTPGQVLLGGDSAGGNLALAVLSHLSGHPHPNSRIVKKLDLDAKLKGLLVVAPWVSADEKKYPSVRKYRNRDIVGYGCATYWSKAYIGVGDEDEYMWAALAGTDWWKGVRAEKILMLAGEEEKLVDAVTDVAVKMDKGADQGTVKFVVGKKETHVQGLQMIDEKKVIELGEKCQEGAIRIWIRENLAN